MVQTIVRVKNVSFIREREREREREGEREGERVLGTRKLYFTRIVV